MSCVVVLGQPRHWCFTARFLYAVGADFVLVVLLLLRCGSVPLYRPRATGTLSEARDTAVPSVLSMYSPRSRASFGRSTSKRSGSPRAAPARRFDADGCSAAAGVNQPVCRWFSAGTGPALRRVAEFHLGSEVDVGLHRHLISLSSNRPPFIGSRSILSSAGTSGVSRPRQMVRVPRLRISRRIFCAAPRAVSSAILPPLADRGPDRGSGFARFRHQGVRARRIKHPSPSSRRRTQALVQDCLGPCSADISLSPGPGVTVILFRVAAR